MRAEGHYFLPHSSACIPATLTLSGGALIIACADSELTQIPLATAHASSRLGNLRRKIALPDGGCFETADNDAIDAMFRPPDRLVDRLEKSWRAVLVAVILSAAAATGFALYGVPATALWMADHTPQSIAHFASVQTLDTLDGRGLSPSKLSKAVRDKQLALFAAVAAHAPRGVAGYRLLFRDAPFMGPNAFALPDGTIVATDQIIRMARTDDEIQGVYAHEMAHVDHAHGLQRIYQASLVPATIAFITGDISQAGHIANILPGILLQSAYSRQFEQQADDDAAKLLRRMHKNPAALAALLERLEATMCGRNGCGASWVGSHPATAERAARLRKS